jgi:hypothetical protein
MCYNVGFQGGTFNWTNPFRSRQYGWATPGVSLGYSRLRAQHRGKHCTGGGAAYLGIGAYGCGSRTRYKGRRDFEIGYSHRAYGGWGGRQENYTRRFDDSVGDYSRNWDGLAVKIDVALAVSGLPRILSRDGVRVGMDRDQPRQER